MPSHPLQLYQGEKKEKQQQQQKMTKNNSRQTKQSKKKKKKRRRKPSKDAWNGKPKLIRSVFFNVSNLPCGNWAVAVIKAMLRCVVCIDICISCELFPKCCHGSDVWFCWGFLSTAGPVRTACTQDHVCIWPCLKGWALSVLRSIHYIARSTDLCLQSLVQPALSYHLTVGLLVLLFSPCELLS